MLRLTEYLLAALAIACVAGCLETHETKLLIGLALAIPVAWIDLFVEFK